ncbi:unnamed protein product [Oikopleura dioica]|uniref:Uncharacterized protein n=1 Tax=Oikopleura dioica TaxID=34765 RepID=E4XAE6_OIKDI|nr:unnamed protein product [Oikopleura dioica]
MLKRDADLKKVQSENSINKLKDENQQLHERLKGELLRSGKSPMEQDSQKLFPYHFAKNREVYDALTPPPIDRRSYLLTLARSNLTEDAKICFLKNVLDNSIPCDMSHMTFTGEDNLSCIGIAAQTREYRFAQSMVYVAEQGENARRSSEIDKMKVDHKEEIEKYQTEIEKLKKEATGNVMMEDEEIKRKLDIAVERIGILAFENDVLKDDSCKKEKLLKAEILNLNKCISRQKAKCADLSTEIDKLKKESAILSERVTNKESERKKENENLKIEIDMQHMLKRDADLQKVQLENSINELQDENQRLLGQLKGGKTK